jgi:hypothetical protein
MVGTLPMLLAIAAVLFSGERFHPGGWVALAASAVGAALIALSSKGGRDHVRHSFAALLAPRMGSGGRGPRQSDTECVLGPYVGVGGGGPRYNCTSGRSQTDPATVVHAQNARCIHSRICRQFPAQANTGVPPLSGWQLLADDSQSIQRNLRTGIHRGVAGTTLLRHHLDDRTQFFGEGAGAGTLLLDHLKAESV